MNHVQEVSDPLFGAIGAGVGSGATIGMLSSIVKSSVSGGLLSIYCNDQHVSSQIYHLVVALIG